MNTTLGVSVMQERYTNDHLVLSAASLDIRSC